MSFKTDIVNVVSENGQFPVSHRTHEKTQVGHLAVRWDLNELSISVVKLQVACLNSVIY